MDKGALYASNILLAEIDIFSFYCFYSLIMLCLFTGIYHNYFWQVSSIIFVDLPVSTGFTYATTEFAAQRSDWILVHQVHQFLRKVFIQLFLVISQSSPFLCFWFCLQINLLVNQIVTIMCACLQWLIDHPNFSSNEVYIGGDSYSGIPIPVIVQEISRGKRLVCDSTCTAKLE